ncbi:CoA transferase subunit A [Gilliamella apicola]|uniref:Branched-chain amino acid dehydrogenase n=1 Tax=Gilliamella apicola TaxID=1196095 RepID=A0A2V4E0J8_9GAMM|nr:CoA transferase subunit A [Gilliamella apicola]PXZ06655.1 branched-chain amino acid dehydrogenase [Gilliamella apicola]
MDKVVSIEQALSSIKDETTMMVGGFMASGSPETLIDYLCQTEVKNLTLICNDTGLIDQGVGKMVMLKKFRKIIASHIGLNKETGRQMNAGETQVELIPQGTLAERIRCAGYGLGGVLTPTGIGTLVEEGKKKIEVDGKQFLLETPLFADVALLYAAKVDRAGNIVYKGAMNNFNNVMASAAKLTIVEAGQIVDIGELNPQEIATPGIFVDYIVKGRGC